MILSSISNCSLTLGVGALAVRYKPYLVCRHLARESVTPMQHGRPNDYRSSHPGSNVTAFPAATPPGTMFLWPCCRGFADTDILLLCEMIREGGRVFRRHVAHPKSTSSTAGLRPPTSNLAFGPTLAHYDLQPCSRLVGVMDDRSLTFLMIHNRTLQRAHGCGSKAKERIMHLVCNVAF